MNEFEKIGEENGEKYEDGIKYKHGGTFFIIDRDGCGAFLEDDTSEDTIYLLLPEIRELLEKCNKIKDNLSEIKYLEQKMIEIEDMKNELNRKKKATEKRLIQIRGED